MDGYDDTPWGFQRQGIGKPVPRKEDRRLLLGEGQYTDDVNLPGQAYLVMVRSSHGHGIIRSVDVEAAKAMPGVLGVYVGADLEAAGYGHIRCMMPVAHRDGSPMKQPAWPALALDRVRYVGDPVACVVAETAIQAKDAAEAVEIDIDSLPALVKMRDAVQPDAPPIYDAVPGNVATEFHYGDSDKVAAAFAGAAHVTRLSLVNSRVVVNAMEPRSSLAEYSPGENRWTLHACSQGVMGLRNMLAKDILKVAPEKVRVLTGQVGGSFGMKIPVFAEHVCLVHAARTLGHPVKWTDERSGSFVSDTHGRDHEYDAELALDRDGNFLAVRVEVLGNLGGHIAGAGPYPPTGNIVKNVISVYKTPLVEVTTRCVITNTVPISAYRGAGRPEANYIMERLIDNAAREMSIDRVELRRRNHIKPEQLPYTAPSGAIYDSGEFTAILDEALAVADWNGFEVRKKESAARGKMRGRGMSDFLEATAPLSNEMGAIRFEPDGTVTLFSGTLDYGQGHGTAFAQLIEDTLGIPFDKIRLVQGDSDQLDIGGGSGGSKSLMSGGSALLEAGEQVIERGKKIAAVALEASAADIEFAEGNFTIAGTDRFVGILDLAAKLRSGMTLPEGVPTALDVSHRVVPKPSAYPNGCHIAEVEIDPETGRVEIVKYESVNDFGNLMNPLLVEGQVHGGIVQGIGQALMEHTVYDEDGQLVTGSFMDYTMPRAGDAPKIHFVSHPVPATTNALGAKGCGEAGCAGALPSIMNAVVDALSDLGITHIDMPATPLRIWQAIQEARGKKAS